MLSLPFKLFSSNKTLRKQVSSLTSGSTEQFSLFFFFSSDFLSSQRQQLKNKENNVFDQNKNCYKFSVRQVIFIVWLFNPLSFNLIFLW